MHCSMQAKRKEGIMEWRWAFILYTRLSPLVEAAGTAGEGGGSIHEEENDSCPAVIEKCSRQRYPTCIIPRRGITSIDVYIEIKIRNYFPTLRLLLSFLLCHVKSLRVGIWSGITRWGSSKAQRRFNVQPSPRRSSSHCKLA